MIIVRFRVRCQPGTAEQVLTAFKDVIPPSRAVPGVLSGVDRAQLRKDLTEQRAQDSTGRPA